MRNNQLNNLTILKPIRQKLRNGATKAEQVLWHYLQGRQLSGRKFRRQHSIGLFVLDFYCPSERLAIELDGEVHDSIQAKAHDEERQKAIETLDIKLLRFRNEAVLQTIDYVLTTIRQQFEDAALINVDVEENRMQSIISDK